MKFLILQRAQACFTNGDGPTIAAQYIFYHVNCYMLKMSYSISNHFQQLLAHYSYQRIF